MYFPLLKLLTHARVSTQKAKTRPRSQFHHPPLRPSLLYHNALQTITQSLPPISSLAIMTGPSRMHIQSETTPSSKAVPSSRPGIFHDIYENLKISRSSRAQQNKQSALSTVLRFPFSARNVSNLPLRPQSLTASHLQPNQLICRVGVRVKTAARIL